MLPQKLMAKLRWQKYVEETEIIEAKILEVFDSVYSERNELRLQNAALIAKIHVSEREGEVLFF